MFPPPPPALFFVLAQGEEDLYLHTYIGSTQIFRVFFVHYYYLFLLERGSDRRHRMIYRRFEGGYEGDLMYGM